MITTLPPRFKHAFVTGGTGMVGASLCNRLSAMGVRVTAFSRNSQSKFLHDSVDLVTGDITDSDAVLKAAEDADIVFHVAAAVHGSESTFEGFRLINVTGTENVINAVETLGIRMIYVSSVNVDGFNRGQLADPYAHTKAMAEELVLEAIERGVDAVVIRPATVFGSESGRSGLVVDRILSGSLKVLPAPSRKISPVWVEDLAIALTSAAQVGVSGRIYTVAGPTVSTGEFARSISESVGIRSFFVPVPAWLITIPLQIAWWTKAITRWIPPVSVEAVRSGSVHDGGVAAAELGFSYTPIVEIFRKP
ncbi:MAG: NAD-dependent epimerase/dehydratase family protein [Chloroflexi bacterium]|nr:NAD-dependent epimerase/dehydratase family protein [Chloroflexota bacterium]